MASGPVKARSGPIAAHRRSPPKIRSPVSRQPQNKAHNGSSWTWRFLGDGTAVVIHDVTVDRCSSSKGHLKDMTEADLVRDRCRLLVR